MDEHTDQGARETLPGYARLPINRCNLPPAILGGLTFQRHPAQLALDGVAQFHGEFFRRLDEVEDARHRGELFKCFMAACFFLNQPEQAGFTPHRPSRKRHKADYLRLLRGWLFDSEGKEGAILKGWVESRFGLLPRCHHGPLGDFSSENYQTYLCEKTQGLYNTNALESQIDLLYTYCQYELARQYPGRSHFHLYRGTNRIDYYDILEHPDSRTWILLLNNLNSFSDHPERADEFGDYVLKGQIPLPKLLYFPGLLPNALRGEQEFLVIGGVYQVERHFGFV
jgi:NAD+--dinitrogen-reductase ADP-D-ribosyltransferase